MNPLDRPAWHSLTTTHAAFALGDSPLARRYARDVNVFAASVDDGSEAMHALAALVLPGERVFVLQVPEIAVPLGLVRVQAARGVQMVATRPIEPEADGDAGVRIEVLSDADADAMLALATLTKPGPFLPRTHRIGAFVGVRGSGAAAGPPLLAMAGERFRFPGYTEVSGVCTHPDARGRGLARALSAHVASAIKQRGDQPFLHAWTSNATAIRLYEGLGFVLRTEVNVAVLERPAA